MLLLHQCHAYEDLTVTHDSVKYIIMQLAWKIMLSVAAYGRCNYDTYCNGNHDDIDDI